MSLLPPIKIFHLKKVSQYKLLNKKILNQIAFNKKKNINTKNQLKNITKLNQQTKIRQNHNKK